MTQEANQIDGNLQAVMNQAQRLIEEQSCLELERRYPKEADYQRWLKKFGVDEFYTRWSVADFGLEHMGWELGGYFVSGVQGSGKSCLAAALLKSRLHPEQKRPLGNWNLWDVNSDRYEYWDPSKDAMRWFNARALCDYVREGWGNGGEEKAIRELCRHKVLVIDDVGTERGTANQDAVNLPMLRRVIDYAVHNGTDLVVTTNLSVRELAETDPRMASRLCMLEQIKVPDRDMRYERERQRKRIYAKPSK